MSRASLVRLPFSVKLGLGLVAGVVAGMVGLLWRHWVENPDLAHGVVMPIVFIFLWWESRRGVPRYLEPSAGAAWVAAAVLAMGAGVFALGGLYAAVLGWSHALVVFALMVGLVLLLAGAWAVCARRDVRLVAFNWNAGVGVGLWVLCAPLPPGLYARLTQALQLGLSEALLWTLHFLGVAAGRVGNVIVLTTGSVGVEEACSGVRSLISCVFVGLFFSATLVKRPMARAVMIGLAAPLALGMNFVRSLALTLLANAGVSIAGVWHDAMGYAVLAVVTLILMVLATKLEGRTTVGETGASDELSGSVSVATRWAGRALAGVAGGVGVLAVIFWAATRAGPASAAAPMAEGELVPSVIAGWQVQTEANLYRFKDTLGAEMLLQRSFYRETTKGPEVITIYVARWGAGQATVSAVALHTPDACWPGSGWVAGKVEAQQVGLTTGGRALPVAQYRIFERERQLRHVWFWHIFAGRVISYDSIYSPIELLRVAWRYGFQRDAEQYFVRISSNRSWEEIRDEEPTLRSLECLRHLGL